MNMEDALKTAMELESNIRDIYATALEQCSDPAGRRFFAMLRDDEQYHLDYLTARMSEWQNEGKIDIKEIKTHVPTADEMQACLDGLQKTMAQEDRGVLQQLLSNALNAEVATSSFYEKMVVESDDRARMMFSRFLEIESSHIAAVQAELDYVMNTGYWFDFKEFDME